MSDFDDLRNRLNKLREFNKKEKITDEELEEKLRKLKGLNVTDGASKPLPSYYVPPKFKSDSEEADYLLKQLTDEVDVDNKFNDKETETDDLFSRLKNLKEDGSKDLNDDPKSVLNDLSKSQLNPEEFGKELDYIKNRMKDLNYDYKNVSKSKDKSKNKSTNDKIDSIFKSDSSEEDEEEKFTQIVKKFVDEAEIEKTTGISSSPKEEDEFKVEKFDFCYICNEDAILECVDCDDRFCLNCFKEFHQDPDYKYHKYKKFQKK